MQRNGVFICAVSLSLLAGCFSSPSPRSNPPEVTVADSQSLFVDVTADSGVSFVQVVSSPAEYQLPDIMGSGCALLDYDLDGDLDILVVELEPQLAGSEAGLRLFEQTDVWKFEDVTTRVGLRNVAAPDENVRGMGVAVGDCNNDGAPDIYMSAVGGGRLWLNRSGRFVDATASSGLPAIPWGASACWFDIDRDGWLDLFVTNYVQYTHRVCEQLAGGQRDFCGPHLFPATTDFLFRNRTGEIDTPGKGPFFEDISQQVGISSETGAGLGVVATDVNSDGWDDLYVANDQLPNFLWLNEGGRKFTNIATLAGCASDRLGKVQASMGLAAGDVNLDGHEDLIITHLDDEYSTVYLCSSDAQFHDATHELNLVDSTLKSTGFGVVLADFNRDRALDLAIVNGRVKRLGADHAVEEDFWKPYRQSTQLIFGGGEGQFVGATSLCRGESESVSRGLAAGDVDGDGRLDLVVTSLDGPCRVLKNQSTDVGHWIGLRLRDAELGGRFAYGAQVTVHCAKGALRQTLHPNCSYLSSHAPGLFLGLGDVDQIETVEITWPTNPPQYETLMQLKLDQWHDIKRGEGDAR